jgi:hypothetical protein
MADASGAVPLPLGEGLRLAERSDAPAERVRVVRLRRGPTLTLSRKSDRLTALRRSSPLPTGEGGRVRVHEPERLGPFPQEAGDDGDLAGAVRSGEEDEGGMKTIARALA